MAEVKKTIEEFTAIERARVKYGDGFDYDARPGTEVDLTLLKDGEYVCAGGKDFHVIMTPKNG